MREIRKETIESYKVHLINEEKSNATVEKYVRDVCEFASWLDDAALTKERVLKYKAILVTKYKSASVNSVLSSLNNFFNFMEWYDLKVKALKIQKQIFSSKDKELTKSEYERLLAAAKSNKRLYLVMQTICSTGIRVSELKFVTVDAVNTGTCEVKNKGKIRKVFLPKALQKKLSKYIQMRKIKSGPVFVTKNGVPLDRSNIWSDMKKLCKSAGVAREKVFPHNLRHLFARTYYSLQKDIVRLADILGHSSVNTTRIYTMESGDIHRRQIEKLGLLKE